MERRNISKVLGVDVERLEADTGLRVIAEPGDPYGEPFLLIYGHGVRCLGNIHMDTGSAITVSSLVLPDSCIVETIENIPGFTTEYWNRLSTALLYDLTYPEDTNTINSVVVNRSGRIIAMRDVYGNVYACDFIHNHIGLPEPPEGFYQFILNLIDFGDNIILTADDILRRIPKAFVKEVVVKSEFDEEKYIRLIEGELSNVRRQVNRYKDKIRIMREKMRDVEGRDKSKYLIDGIRIANEFGGLHVTENGNIKWDITIDVTEAIGEFYDVYDISELGLRISNPTFYIENGKVTDCLADTDTGHPNVSFKGERKNVCLGDLANKDIYTVLTRFKEQFSKAHLLSSYDNETTDMVKNYIENKTKKAEIFSAE